MTTKTGEFITSERNIVRYSSDDRLSFVLIDVIIEDVSIKLWQQSPMAAVNWAANISSGIIFSYSAKLRNR